MLKANEKLKLEADEIKTFQENMNVNEEIDSINKSLQQVDELMKKANRMKRSKHFILLKQNLLKFKAHLIENFLIKKKISNYTIKRNRNSMRSQHDFIATSTNQDHSDLNYS